MCGHAPGTPGIGKSCFKFPLMHWLMDEGEAKDIVMEVSIIEPRATFAIVVTVREPQHLHYHTHATLC